MGYTGEQKREYQREWMRKRREEFFSDKSCVKCNSIDSLELDHINPATKVSHSIWSWSKARRDEELAKCQVLCENCHKEKSATEAPKGSQHGMSKLTEDEVVEMRRMYSSGVRQYELVRLFKIDKRTVSLVVNNKMWKHI